MAHGKALGQYRVIPNGFVWDVRSEEHTSELQSQ